MISLWQVMRIFFNPSHRVIVDDAESSVVFNGLTPLLDAMFTSSSNYIAGQSLSLFTAKTSSLS